MKRFLSILLLGCILVTSIFISSCDGDEPTAPSVTTDTLTTDSVTTTTSASTTKAATTGKTPLQEAPEGTFCAHKWDSGKSENFSCGTKLTHTCSLCKATKAEISATGNTEHSFGSNNLCTTCGIDKVTVNGVPLSKFVIVYGDDAYSKNIATSIKNKIKAVKGYSLSLRSVADEVSEYEILVGKTNRDVTKEFFAKGTNFTDKNYEVIISDNKIAIASTSEDILELAKTKVFDRFFVDRGEFRLTDAISFKGDEHNVDERLNDSDIRIASNNVYFHGTPANRKNLLLSGIDKMDADVLMLQEVSSTWHNLIDSSLVSMGYTAVPTSTENISGVTANDNYTPIWYRSNVVELIKYGYDQFESVKYKPDSYLSSSKSYTWALFKDKATGKQFVSISTHFTWASSNFNPTPNELRVSDANEIKALVQSLQTKYGSNIPIVVMGDLNCKQNEDPHTVLDSIMNSVRLDGLAKYKNNLSYGTAGYEFGSLPYKEWGYIIDHTFVSGSGYNINQYQHVINEYSLNASDHLPLLIDIEFTK